MGSTGSTGSRVRRLPFEPTWSRSGSVRRARLGARHERQLQRRHRRGAAAAGDHAERGAQGRADARATSSRSARTAASIGAASARPRRRRGCTSRSSRRGTPAPSCTRTRSGARSCPIVYAAARRRRDRGLRDAEGAGRRHDARAPRVDSRSSTTTRTWPRLARSKVGETLRDHPDCHGFLLRRHGLYTWGATLPEARPARGDHRVPARKRRPQGGSVMALVKIPSEQGWTLREHARGRRPSWPPTASSTSAGRRRIRCPPTRRPRRCSRPTRARSTR